MDYKRFFVAGMSLSVSDGGGLVRLVIDQQFLMIVAIAMLFSE